MTTTLYADASRTLTCDGVHLAIANRTTGKTLTIHVAGPEVLSLGAVPAHVAAHLRGQGEEPSAWLAIVAGPHPRAVVPSACRAAVEQALTLGREERSRRQGAEAARRRAEREWDATHNDGGDGYNPHRRDTDWRRREPEVKGDLLDPMGGED